MRTKITPQVLISLVFLGTLTIASGQNVQLVPTSNLALASISTEPVVADYIVAIVNAEPITSVEVRTRLIRFEKRLAFQNSGLPPRTELVKEVLEELIQEKLQLQLAKQSGIKVDDRTIDTAVNNYALQNNITIAELRQRSSVDGIGYDQIRADIQRQLLIQKLREREVPRRVDISDAQIDEYVKHYLEDVSEIPYEVDLAQILIAVPDNAGATEILRLQKRAESLHARAISGEDFFKLAQEYSDGSDAENGGRMGLRAFERYPTLFIDATSKLNTGDISTLQRSAAGFHILKVLARNIVQTQGFIINQTRARHILLRTDSQQSESQAALKLSELKRRLDAKSADFTELAKQYSQDGSATSGGDLGWSNPKQYVPEFENALKRLTIGEISNPIVTRFGVHLIVVDERRKAQISTDELRESAKSALREKKLDENYAAWLKELRKNAYVEMREPPSSN